MKTPFLVSIVFLCSVHCLAQTFEVDTVFKNGPLNKQINLVFVGDGYRASELGKYRSDVEEVVEVLFNMSPFKEYKNYFNVFAVKVISNQSGADHPRTSSDVDCQGVPFASVDNYFGSTFDYGQIHRLLYPVNASKVGLVLADHLPQYDQAFVIVNSEYYGGAGGEFATCSDHEAGKEVAIHEIGHSFANLSDEYWAGPQYAGESPNMTQQSNPTLVKWKGWVNIDGTGVYPHEESPVWNRPHQACKMRYLGVPLCNVCVETFIERIHGLVNPLTGYAPQETIIPLPATEETIDFSLSLHKPQPNTLKAIWTRNNVPFAKNEESVSIPASSFIDNGAIIRATITDTIQLTKHAIHRAEHIYVVEWKVGEVVTDIDITPVEREYEISVFPNPVASELNVSYTLFKPGTVNISVLDLTGRKVRTLVRQRQPAGEHHYTFESQETLPAEYILQLSFDYAIVTRKIIRAR